MKEYQDLIGKVIIAIAIVAAGFLIAQAITGTGHNISSTLNNLATLIRDGLLKIGSVS